MMTPEQRKAQQVAQDAMKDPEVVAILGEPKMQEVLSRAASSACPHAQLHAPPQPQPRPEQVLKNMQSGVPFEIEKAEPEVVAKLRRLQQAGLLNMEWRR